MPKWVLHERSSLRRALTRHQKTKMKTHCNSNPQLRPYSPRQCDGDEPTVARGDRNGPAYRFARQLFVAGARCFAFETEPEGVASDG